MTSFEKNLRFSLGNIIGNSSLLFWINGFRPDFRNKIVVPKTELCVEGFQRSGNSFFTMLIKREKNKLKLADHVHVSQQVVRACKWDIPTIVLIRHPKDAIASLMAWDPKLKISLAIRSYSAFYNYIKPYQSSFITGHFDTVITKPYLIIQATNRTFNTDIRMDEFDEQRMKRMRDRWANRTKTMKNAPVPNAVKDDLKRSYGDDIIHNPHYAKALKIYESYLKIAV